MNKMVRNTAIVIGTYAAFNVGFQLGKGYLLYIMKKEKLNVEEALKYVKYGSKNGPCKLNHKIIYFIASIE